MKGLALDWLRVRRVRGGSRVASVTRVEWVEGPTEATESHKSLPNRTTKRESAFNTSVRPPRPVTDLNLGWSVWVGCSAQRLSSRIGQSRSLVEWSVSGSPW